MCSVKQHVVKRLVAQQHYHLQLGPLSWYCLCIAQLPALVVLVMGTRKVALLLGTFRLMVLVFSNAACPFWQMILNHSITGPYHVAWTSRVTEEGPQSIEAELHFLFKERVETLESIQQL